MSQQKIMVRILDREYQFAASDEERSSLLSAADYLDSTMRTIKKSNSTLSPEKVSIMAALNISHEMMQLKQAQKKIKSLKESLQNAIELSKQ
jgi:cell division protein ZapA